MNKFANNTVGEHFALRPLTKHQCNHLLTMHTAGTHVDNDKLLALTIGELEDRGLVWWERDAISSRYGVAGLTEAGRLTVLLLAQAGLTEESTR